MKKLALAFSVAMPLVFHTSVVFGGSDFNPRNREEGLAVMDRASAEIERDNRWRQDQQAQAYDRNGNPYVPVQSNRREPTAQDIQGILDRAQQQKNADIQLEFQAKKDRAEKEASDKQAAATEKAEAERIQIEKDKLDLERQKLELERDKLRTEQTRLELEKMIAEQKAKVARPSPAATVTPEAQPTP